MKPRENVNCHRFPADTWFLLHLRPSRRAAASRLMSELDKCEGSLRGSACTHGVRQVCVRAFVDTLSEFFSPFVSCLSSLGPMRHVTCTESRARQIYTLLMWQKWLKIPKKTSELQQSPGNNPGVAAMLQNGSIENSWNKSESADISVTVHVLRSAPLPYRSSPPPPLLSVSRVSWPAAVVMVASRRAPLMMAALKKERAK